MKAAWTKASQSDITGYKLALREKLKSVLPPSESLSCQDTECCNVEHIAQLNNYSSQLIHACLESATNTIPSSFHSEGKNKVIPGWNEYVSPARQKSMLWHDIWLECGHPRDGIVADIMRRTRAAYHYAVRNVKKSSSDIIKQRFASAIVENRNRDFWRELKNVNGGARDTPKMVDGHTQNEYIADLFANKYDPSSLHPNFND